MRRVLTIAALAVLGLAVAVGVTMAASSLTQQSVGLSSEPLTAGEQLALPSDASPEPAPETSPPAKSTTVPETTTGDDRSDNSGSGSEDSGRGRGRGRGGDDD